MSRQVSIDGLADAVQQELSDYVESTTDAVKDAVRHAGKNVKSGIEASAPARTGKYKKSWAVKETDENSHKLVVTVHSRNRYQLAHLLEHGHAKRNGGRVAARPHIAQAEEKGIRELESEIERALKNG